MALEVVWKRTILQPGYRGWKCVFKAMSHAFRAAVWLRHKAYDAGLLQAEKVSIPVISIGNIALGGTGKTPLVRLLSEELSSRMKVAILSRGYRSHLEKQRESTQLKSVQECFVEEVGDEPYLLRKWLSDALIFVGKNRLRSARDAMKAGAQLILLDDGLQHRRLKPMFTLVVIDGKDPLGQGHFFPRGFLRDDPRRLKEADLIVATHIVDRATYERVRDQLSSYSSAPLVGMRLIADADLRGKKVGLFCGLGTPQRFKETIAHLGATIVDELLAPDHRTFAPQKLESFAKNCQQKGAECLVCTEKDWVKLPSTHTSCLPIMAIPVRLVATVGSEHWETFIDQVKKIYA
jgi:tetraacyldisaccharide 4'-kinase